MEANPHQACPDPPTRDFFATHFPWLRRHHVKPNTYCSFCRQSRTKVGPLIEASGKVFICRECVRLCESIFEEHRQQRERQHVEPTA